MLRHCWIAVAALTLAAPAWALYKVIGPDGRITYTDVPPTGTHDTVVPLSGAKAASAAGGDANLPFALRGVAARFPVTLYTIPDCDPCNRGRQALRQRGIPFSERTATSDADREAWQREVGELRAPALKVGGQVLRGLSLDTWNSYLDAAGYPLESRLPANYQAPEPQPLAPVSAAASKPAPGKPAAAAAAPPPPPASGGFRF